jgi:hypothetical protein
VVAKESVRTAQTAIETYATDHNGSYAGATSTGLQAAYPGVVPETTIEDVAPVTYAITVPSQTGNRFSIVRHANGAITYPCDPPGVDGCGPSGTWN